MSGNEYVSFYVAMEDPESTEPVNSAYCVLTETHMNYETQALIIVYQCWRTKEAYLAKRKPFNKIQVSLPPDEGGKEFFSHPDAGEASRRFGNLLRDWCLDVNKDLRQATRANAEETNTNG
jgi:hypothetical protein